MQSFGELLGAEILEAREAQHFTQLSLAEEVFDDENYVRRIGDYETGKVKRPQAKVYRPICDFLGISAQRIGELKALAADAESVTDNELADLRAEKGSLEKALFDLQTLTRAQLETLASRFELDRPYAASDGELIDFLSKKAQDYRALLADVDAIDDGLKRLSNLKSAARAAIESGDLEEVETLLSRVQEVELEEAAKTAELRANNALLRGKPDLAFRILTAAAESFAAIDPVEPLRKRFDYMRPLYLHGLRYGGEGLALGAAMLQDPRMAGLKTTDPVLWSKIQNNLANALQEQGTRTGGEAGTTLLAQAVTTYRAALEVLSKEAHPEAWSTTQNNLANALKNQGTRTDGEAGATLLAQAVNAYRAALEVRTRAAHPVDWATTQNNLATALKGQGIRTGGAAGAILLAQAVSACRAALEVTTQKAHPVAWATTQNNLANALHNLGIRTGREAGAILAAEAVTAYRAALEVRTREAYPVDWAQTQNNLAIALSKQGNRTGGEAGAALLAEAVTACRAALEVYTREAHPVDWATTMENLALAEEAAADHDTCADPQPFLDAALSHVSAALEIFDPAHLSYHFNAATALKSSITEKLAAHDPP